jgi:hypothetical protein
VNPLNKFTIASVAKKINKININVALSHQNPFPGLNLLSNYRFEKRFVKIFPNGDIQGGMCRLIASLIDFPLSARSWPTVIATKDLHVMIRQACF